jgi:hypothetical protein
VPAASGEPHPRLEDVFNTGRLARRPFFSRKS